jgi:prepilin-type N-terminal cleavage/methylation domain-containing protein
MFFARTSAARRGRGGRRRAFTLLEVIISIAILATAMASLRELLQMALDRQKSAFNQTIAQLQAEAKMAQILSDKYVPNPVNQAELEISTSESVRDSNWLYSVEIRSLPEPALVGIRLTVEQNVDPSIYLRGKYTLVRWMIDPDALEAMIPEPTAPATTTPTTPSSPPAAS